MATKKDIDTIKIISAVIIRSRVKRLDVAIELSGGENYYARAINSVKRVGLWAMILFPIASFVSTIMMMPTYFDLGLHDQIWALIFTASVVAIIPTILGYKLWTLCTTPTFTLVSLIIIAILSLLFIYGVLPVILFAFSIIALIRWSTYRDWFYNIDVDYYKDKSNANKTKN